MANGRDRITSIMLSKNYRKGMLRVEIIDSPEASKRRKVSKGFCGYEWMIESIIYHGKISTI
jgi:hypothetical protein